MSEHVSQNGALQAMSDDCQPPGAIYRPVKIEKVIVGSDDSFTLILNSVNLPEQRRDEGLQMAIG